MTVVLAGIGADGKNTDPVPPIYDDGRFEYIPIPETELGTAESRTYGSESLRYQDKSMAEFVNWIKPGSDDERKKDSLIEIDGHPLHYDPDLSSLTYGESEARRGYVSKLMNLDEDDILAFYAGLDDGRRLHRYIIGYFTVESVVSTAGLEGNDRKRVFEEHRDNAHAKRFLGEGKSKYDGVVIVDGKRPGGLLEKVGYKISTYTRYDGNRREQYYLSDKFARAFPVDDPSLTHDASSNHKDDKIWLGFKPAITLNMDGTEFVEKLNSTV